MKIYNILKKLVYSFGANIVSFGVSVLMVVFVPKFLPVEEYGMWQLFLFYFSYLGFMHLGWEDGIYLRYAGKSFNELKPKVFSGQFYALIVWILFLSIVAVGFAFLVFDDLAKRTAFICAISLAVFQNFYNLCNFIMQITDRIKEYAKLLFTERVLLILFVLFWLILGYRNFNHMFLAKVGSLTTVVIVGAYLCRRLLKPSFPSVSGILHEASLNIEVGSKLMIANIASMLIIGIIRYGISIGWDVATFGKVSLTLSISNFLMIFISSVSVVFFPILKHMDKERLPSIYLEIRGMLSCVLFFMLIFYYPLEKIVAFWLPKYADTLIYMAVLFPVCLFESKVGLLINTYLKSLRQETLMLKINATSVAVSAVVTFFTVYILHDLNITVFSIVALYAFRCELAEYQMEKLLHIRLKKYITVELLMVTIFIVTGVGFNNWWVTIIYGAAYVVYLLGNRRQIAKLMRVMRR